MKPSAPFAHLFSLPAERLAAVVAEAERDLPSGWLVRSLWTLRPLHLQARAEVLRLVWRAYRATTRAICEARALREGGPHV
jgi:hypothetical protein